MPERDDQPESTSFRALIGQAARYSDIAFMIPAGMIVGYLAGALLSRWLPSKWTIVTCVLVGVVAGFVEMIRRLVICMISGLF